MGRLPKRPEVERKTTTISFGKVRLRQIEKIAKAMDITKSELVRRWVDDGIRKYVAEQHMDLTEVSDS